MIAFAALFAVCVFVTLAGFGWLVVLALGAPMLLLLTVFIAVPLSEPARNRIRRRHRDRLLNRPRPADQWPDAEPEPVISAPVRTDIVPNPGRPMVALLPVYEEETI